MGTTRCRGFALLKISASRATNAFDFIHGCATGRPISDATRMNYYQHHIGDHLVATAHLSFIEEGVYRRLLDRYYSTELPLSLDETRLFRLMRAHSDDDKLALRTILEEFFIRTDAGWTHQRADSDIAAFKSKSIKSSQAAQKRWAKAAKQSGKDATNAPKRETAASNRARPASSEPSPDASANPTQPGNASAAPAAVSKSKSSNGQRLPADWQPSANDVRFCEQNRPDLEPEAVAHQFRDYWIAQPDATGKKTDWSATWRNWVRKERGSTLSHGASWQSKQDERQTFVDQITGRTRKTERQAMKDITPPPDWEDAYATA